MFSIVSAVLFLILLSAYLGYKRKIKTAIAFGILSIISCFTAFSMYQDSKELKELAIGDRRSQILSSALIAASLHSDGQAFIEKVEELGKDGKITNADYAILRPMIPNQIVADVDRKFPDAKREEMYLSRISLSE